MFRFYNKLALILFFLLSLLGALWFQGIQYTSEKYQQEINQKLNFDLARHIASEYLLIQDNYVNQKNLKSLFHHLMVINPSIEIYLLNTQGDIIAYSAENRTLDLDLIDTGIIEQFLTQKAQLPLTGANPRNALHQEVFSAAKIVSDNKLQGYLYIILGSEKYLLAQQQSNSSIILNHSLLILITSILFTIAFGFVLFSFLTRRLSLLSQIIQKFSNPADTSPLPLRYPEHTKLKDEVDYLGQHFNSMADRIEMQIKKLKSKDQTRRELIANVSHDLKTPLTTLQGYLETLCLKQDQLTETEKNHYLDITFRQSQRLNQLVDELFELAKLDSCENILVTEPFSLTELIHDVAQKFELRCQQKAIRLIVDLNTEQNTWVNGDIAMIQRVLENLLENAIRHTPQQGEIKLGLSQDHDQVIVRISDNGQGIPADELANIFKRFYRIDKSRNKISSGLGLAITKRILELHGSNINVQSQLSKGTTFTFPMQHHQN